MTDITNINEERAARAANSRLWSAKDMAQALLRDIESGKINPSQIVVHMLNPEADGGLRHHYYAAGIGYDTHIALLNVALRRTIEEWLG
jgi:hypothetical protein